MLYIHAKRPENAIKGIDHYFNTYKTKDWFNRQDVKDVILELDNTVAVKDEYLESPILGVCHQIDYLLFVKGLYYY